MTKLIMTDSVTDAPLRVTERSAAPTTANTNDIYLDDGTNTASGNVGWRRYTGSAWEDVSAASGGGLSTATELTIATGSITKTQNYHSIDTEGDAATDDLDTISGGTTDDMLYIFAASDVRDVVIKNGTGNILTFGSADITLNEDHKIVMFIYDGTNWREVSNAAAGAGTGDMVAATYDPAVITEQLVGLTASQTLTNKSIDGDNNTVTNIGFTAFDTDVGDTMKFSAGAYLDSPAITVTSDGATISINFEKSGGGDVRVIFNVGVATVDCTPILSAALTAGSDVSPQINYVYILQSAPTVLTVSTSSFPATSIDHAPVATVFCQSAASLQTDGAYKVHVWTDHMGNGGLGHLAHLNAWIRNQKATWISGVAVTPTITVNGGAEDNVDVATTAGVVRQLHEHSYPVFDTAVSSDVYVVNHNTAAYTIINDLNAADQDDAGNAIGNNDWTNLVLWGVVNEVSADCKLFLNLPSGFHSTAVGATVDAESMSNYTMPSEYTGVGFLIARLTLKYSTGSSGTWTLEENLDLRASGAVGGGSGTGGTEFEDNVFRILNVTDPTKEIAFDAANIATATTRTVTMPDADVALADVNDLPVANLADGTDGELITWDAVGAPATVAVGTSGHVLTSNGVGVAPTFQAAAGGGTGAMTVLVGPTTLGSTSATIDLTSISAAYQDLVLIVSARGDTAAAAVDVNVRFNGDTGSNYSYNMDVIGTGGASTVTSNDAQTDVGLVTAMPGSTATANYHAAIMIEIIDYTNTGKTRQGYARASNITSNLQMRSTEAYFAWMNTANAINQITLTPSAGNFDTGTVYTLYGRS